MSDDRERKNLSRRRFLTRTTAGLGGALAASAFPGILHGSGGDRPNVLFIPVDDLRPQINCYGYSQMVTPNLDRLATGGALFERAYCQAPVCGASRCSLLSGCRPQTTGIHSYHGRIDKAMPDVLTMPQHFKNNGYATVSLGKVYHVLGDDRKGWSKDPWKPDDFFPGYVTEEALARNREKEHRGPPFERADVPDDAYGDGKITNRAIREMKRLKDERFFLAAGYVRPHLPFNAPAKYWDLYDRDEIELPEHDGRPENAPRQAMHNWGELRHYYGIPSKGGLSDEKAKKLIHAYYASVSYIDAQVGKLLDALDRLGLAENTIVCLWGDHGWNLREHGLWCKHSCFETSLWSPVLVCGPGVPAGIRTDGLTEFVDIYPSLADLCGLSVPDHIEGSSFAPLLREPDRPWKKGAFSGHRGARSVKTDRYRYTRWVNKKGERYAHMLYDHKKDPKETVSIADRPANKDLVKRLNRLMDGGWKGVRRELG